MTTTNTIVIPVHNEEENIPTLLERLLKEAPTCNIVIINDNSSDNSGEVANKIAESNSNISVIYRDKQEGLHAAIITGLKHALLQGAEIIITMDGDLSHSPSDISRLLKVKHDGGIVIGSRFVKGGVTDGWEFSRKLISFLARKTSSLLVGVKAEDCSSGFKLYSREALQKINLDNFVTKGYAFQIETVVRAEREGLSVKEIPIVFRKRERGYSKVTKKELVRYFKSVLALRVAIKKEYDEK